MGIMGYQNSSWDICDLSKKVSGPRHYNFKIPFMGPIFGPETYILLAVIAALYVQIDVMFSLLMLFSPFCYMS